MKKIQETKQANKAVIFCRISSEKQEDGHSLDAQMRLNSEYCHKNHFNIIKEVKIVESSMGDRPKFYEMIEFIKKSKEKLVLVCHCIDRLHRDFDAMGCINKLRKANKIDIHFTKDGSILTKNSNSSELFRYGLDVLIGNDSSNRTGERVKTAFDKKLEDGTILGPSPLGYLNKERKHYNTQNKHKREPAEVYIDPVRGEFVKKMFTMYATGQYSMNDLRIEITKLGLRSKQNKKIGKSTVERTFANPFYYGYMQSGVLLHKHVYPTLITKEIFDKCQEVRTGKRVNPCKGENFVAKIFLFSGMLKCRHCGCGYACYNKEKMTKKYGMREYIYVRPTKSQGECKHCIELNENEISEQIEIVLQNLYIPQEYLEQIKNDVKKKVYDEEKDQKRKLAKYQEEYAKADEELKKLWRRYFMAEETEKMDKEIYDVLRTDIEVRRDNAQKEMQILAQDDKEFEIGVAQVLQLVENATEIWKSSQLSKKRDILGLLFTNFYVSGESVGFTLVEPFKDMLEYSDSPIWLHNHSISRTKKEKRDITKYTIPLFTKLNTEYMTDTMNCGVAILVFRKKLSRAA